ncbi:MAG: hypothetical protein V3R20_06380, partial [Sphingomonadales bacterium]
MEKIKSYPSLQAVQSPQSLQSQAAIEFWFGTGAKSPGAATPDREIHIGVALAGALTALATIAFYSADGNMAGAVPLVAIILFITVLAIGFFMLRV